jgi:uncharacterized small protein (DUF1192 family)
MGCWHGWHGCNTWYDDPRWHARGWYEPVDWYDEPDWPPRRRHRPSRREAPSVTTEDLEARLAELRDEIAQVEAELVDMRRSGQAGSAVT